MSDRYFCVNASEISLYRFQKLCIILFCSISEVFISLEMEAHMLDQRVEVSKSMKVSSQHSLVLEIA